MSDTERIVIRDHALFAMPRNPEYQFPAMATLQMYVDTYEQKMKLADVSRGRVKYELSYSVDMPAGDWVFFREAGFAPSILPDTSVINTEADIVVDLSDARIESFPGTTKHVCQICCIIAGIGGCPPLPVLRQVKPCMSESRWLSAEPYFVDELVAKLLRIKNYDITGVIAPASRATYLAASMGLAVVELIPEGRPRTWLSKFTNTLYRGVQSVSGDIQVQINRAMGSIMAQGAKKEGEHVCVKQ